MPGKRSPARLIVALSVAEPEVQPARMRVARRAADDDPDERDPAVMSAELARLQRRRAAAGDRLRAGIVYPWSRHSDPGASSVSASQ